MATTAKTKVKTPHERLAAIDAEIQETQERINALAADGLSAVEQVARLRALEDEKAPVLRAVANWDKIRKAKAHEARAEELDATAAAVEEKVADWQKRFDKLLDEAAPVVKKLFELASEIETATGMKANSAGPTVSSEVTGATSAVATAVRRLTDAYFVRFKRGEKVDPMKLEVVSNMRQGLHSVPEGVRTVAKMERARAKAAWKHVESKGGTT